MIGTLAVLTGLAALPLIRERMRTPVNDHTRRSATGHFVKLSQGTTHYAVLGAARGPVAVCVHGLSTPSFVWRGLARKLAAQGYRIVIYDLYGRGFSDRVAGDQTPDFFVRQLKDLLDHLDIKDDVTLFGYSMGGVIGASFATQYPDMLRRLILIAPAGMEVQLGRVAKFATDTPVLGDWLFHMGYPRQLKQGALAEADLPSSIEGLDELRIDELSRRGYLKAMLSSVRHALRRPIPETHKALIETGVPVAAIWGQDDTVIPISSLGTLAQWNRGVQHEVIDGAGHGLVYTHTEEVAEAIRRLTGLARD